MLRIDKGILNQLAAPEPRNGIQDPILVYQKEVLQLLQKVGGKVNVI